MYAQRLVAVIEAHCAGATVEDKTMRTLGAVVFKNLVKAKWAPEVSGKGKSYLRGDVVVSSEGLECTAELPYIGRVWVQQAGKLLAGAAAAVAAALRSGYWLEFRWDASGAWCCFVWKGFARFSIDVFSSRSSIYGGERLLLG